MNDLPISPFKHPVRLFTHFPHCRGLVLLALLATCVALPADAQLQTASTPSIDVPVMGSSTPKKAYHRHKKQDDTAARSATANKPALFNLKPVNTKLQNKSDFGVGWKPKPLVDTSPKPAVQPGMPVTTAAAPKVDPAAEAFLRPMLPFISAVEDNLQIHPKQQQSIQNRLNNLQTVLFGGVIYQDPSECLGKIAELYPQEAQKSRQQLLSEMQKKTLPPRNVFVTTPSHGSKTAIPTFPPKSDASSALPKLTQSSSKTSQKTPRNSWFSSMSNDDPFKNDPFFNDTLSSSNRTQAQPSNRGGGLRALGQGIASLAAVAAPIAGNYYLNKSLGNGTVNNPQYPYNAYPYGYSPYGTAYANPNGLAAGSYYRDPYSGQLVQMPMNGTAPVIRNYPVYTYPSYTPQLPYVQQQSMVTRYP